jgi:hypothetical protein
MNKALDRAQNELATLIERDIREKEHEIERQGRLLQELKEKIQDLHFDIRTLQNT